MAAVNDIEAKGDSLPFSLWLIELWKIPLLANRGFTRPAASACRTGFGLLHLPTIVFASLDPISTPHFRFLRVIAQEKLSPTLLTPAGVCCQRPIPHIVMKQRVGLTQGVGTSTRPAIAPGLDH